MPRKSLFKTISLGLLLLFLLLIGVFHTHVLRLYQAITLYDTDKISANFLTMYKSFNATRIDPSTQPFYFPVNHRTLPKDFIYQGESLTIADFLQQSATHGLMVVKDGEIVFEQYYLGDGPDKPHISFSLAKSFVSALFGIALKEGYIQSIEQNVTDYVPELIGSGYDSVSIKDVLQMSSGVGFNQDDGDFFSDINRLSRALALGRSLDGFTASLNRQQETTFDQYASIDTQVLGMIITRATGNSLSRYLNQKIWQPMGMRDPAFWLIDDSGMELALGGLNVTLRDYAKFGWLYLYQGRWLNALGQSVQIVPQQWVIDSVTPDATLLLTASNKPLAVHSFGYGYQWWIPQGAEDEFMTQGNYGQYIYVDPDQHLVIVKNSANAVYGDKNQDWSAKHIAMFRAISQHLAGGNTFVSNSID